MTVGKAEALGVLHYILQGSRSHLFIMQDNYGECILPFLCAFQPKNFFSSVKMFVFDYCY